MIMSTPATKAGTQFSRLPPGTPAWPFQSLTTKPSKPMRCFSTASSSEALPLILTPFQLENDTITACTPAFSAGG